MACISLAPLPGPAMGADILVEAPPSRQLARPRRPCRRLCNAGAFVRLAYLGQRQVFKFHPSAGGTREHGFGATGKALCWWSHRLPAFGSVPCPSSQKACLEVMGTSNARIT